MKERLAFRQALTLYALSLACHFPALNLRADYPGPILNMTS
jgi:hypothetical protein